ncbi:MAG: hypothetical protein HQ513_12305, partial [Rhodospirillales bacterium]|nr:hypothetical protein [Rhodospirillales bacterium]
GRHGGAAAGHYRLVGVIDRLARASTAARCAASKQARSARITANQQASLERRIVLIESADPGYDWIFSHDIAGLITQYGGANSHMAIRCAEFGLPAAIGCGEKLFDNLLSARVIELNCGSRTIEGLK